MHHKLNSFARIVFLCALTEVVFSCKSIDNSEVKASPSKANPEGTMNPFKLPIGTTLALKKQYTIPADPSTKFIQIDGKYFLQPIPFKPAVYCKLFLPTENHSVGRILPKGLIFRTNAAPRSLHASGWLSLDVDTVKDGLDEQGSIGDINFIECLNNVDVVWNFNIQLLACIFDIKVPSTPGSAANPPIKCGSGS